MAAGASEDGSVSQWVRDVGNAIDEFKDNASVERVSLVGLRLGANVGYLKFTPSATWNPF